jgi:hypothetical protein
MGMTASKAIDKLHVFLGKDSNIQCIGYTKGRIPEKIIIYTIKKSKRKYPTEFEGYEVEVKKMGKLTVEPSKKHGYGI